MSNTDNLKPENLQMAKALKSLALIFIEMTLEKNPEIAKAMGDYQLKIIVTC